MLTEAHGTIVVIDRGPPPSTRPRTLWHVSRRPAPAGYLECVPWTADPITREYNESGVVLLACSVAGARRLMPVGLEPAESDGTTDGRWFAAPAAVRRAA